MSAHLCDGWEHVLSGQDGGGLVSQIQPFEACQRQQSGRTHALVQFAHPRLHVAAEVLHLQQTKAAPLTSMSSTDQDAIPPHNITDATQQ